jgi:hypothetical protein
VVSRTQPPQRLVFLNNNGIASEMAMSGSNPVVAPPNLTNPAATCPVNTVCTQPPVDTCTAAKPCTNNPPPSTCPVNTVCTQPPVDTCTAAKPCTTNPSDTAKGIVLYNGDTQRVTNLLTQSTNQAGVMVQKGSDPIGTVVNIATVRKEGTMVLVNDAADDLTVYVVLGVAADPTKPMIFNGVLVVAPKALLAQL